VYFMSLLVVDYINRIVTASVTTTYERTSKVFFLLAMSRRELFEWIELEPKRYWHSLLFMDQVRYLFSRPCRFEPCGLWCGLRILGEDFDLGKTVILMILLVKMNLSI
jgi:hypothetical protein